MNRFEVKNEAFYGLEARNKMLAGVDKVSRAVRATYGAKGRIVVIDKPEPYTPHYTKDGVTVARSIILEDRAESMGARLVQDVAGRTAMDAGDGTSVTSILTQSIIHKGIQNIQAGASPIHLKNGINKAVAAVIKDLRESSIPCNTERDVINIATVSANNDTELSTVIGKAKFESGVNGSVIVENSPTPETYSTITDGFKFDNGWLSPYFVNKAKSASVEYNNALVFLCNDILSEVGHLKKVIEEAAESKRPLLVIANDVMDDALGYMVANRQDSYNLPIVAVKAPMLNINRTNSLEDLAVLTGGTVVSESKGLFPKDCGISFCGECEKIIVTHNHTTIAGGKGDKEKLKDRLDSIKDQREGLSRREMTLLDSRIARLSGCAATIYVGASSDSELKEKKDRVDDALRATHAAMEEGIVVGGGVALLRAALRLEALTSDNKEEATGISIIIDTIKEPIKQLSENAGRSGDVVIADILRSDNVNLGYNALSDEYEDLMEAGIIDPLKVVRIALENAASAGGLFLMTECILVDKHDKDETK